MTDPQDVTQLLQDWSSGDAQAGERMALVVSDELRRISQRLLRAERPSHTLEPNALVNEAFARLIQVDVEWQDRAHFYAFAARLMRRILINYAEARSASKRGGGQVLITLSEEQAGAVEPEAELIELHEAIEALTRYDERKGALIEMQFFGGLSIEEMASVLDTSPSTVTRDLRFARAWLKDRLS